MQNLESKMRIKWGECLKVGVKSEWVRFLGKETRRTETGYELRVPIGYMKGILDLLHLEKAKGAPTPFISLKPAEEPQLCDLVEHHLDRQVVGKMMWLASDRPDVTYAINQPIGRRRRIGVRPVAAGSPWRTFPSCTTAAPRA
jgi:hypothetical protein